MELQREQEPSEFQILGFNELIVKLRELKDEAIGPDNILNRERQREILAQMRQIYEVAAGKASPEETKLLLPISDWIATHEDAVRDRE